MPRKEGPSIEERMQRAKELYELKQFLKQKNLKELYASRIYKFARISAIAFIWITQLILIDWLLPYNTSYDKVSTSNFNMVMRPNKELFLKSQNDKLFEIEFPQGSIRPTAGDTIVVYKSLLLHDVKKISVPIIKENFLVTTAITYRYMALLLIGATLALTFIFIRGIEVKAFAWIVGIFTSAAGVFFIQFIVRSFL